MDNNLDFFYEKFKINENQKKQYQQYLKLIQEYNKVMNLTGIDDEFGVYLKHYYDSLLVANSIPNENQTIGDIGSGAGFPGIVLAIFYPNNKFDLIEPLTKRCKFLQTVVDEIGLKNVKILNKRAEELEHEKYDFITARAVTQLPILLELSIPLLKVNGKLIALKGNRGKAEIEESTNAFNQLDCQLIEIQEEVLPFEESIRYNLIIQKKKKTNKKYPRNYGQIKKRPL